MVSKTYIHFDGIAEKSLFKFSLNLLITALKVGSNEHELKSLLLTQPR